MRMDLKKNQASQYEEATKNSIKVVPKAVSSLAGACIVA